MVSNPMQRKVRNSFLLGLLVMLIIAILIGAIIFVVVVKPKMEEEKVEKSQTYAYAYRLKPGMSIKSGEEITSSMVESVEIPVQTAITDFIPSKQQTANGELKDIGFVAGYKSKIDLSEGTILTFSMLYEEEVQDSLRYVEYNMITMPTNLDTGNYIDIRLRLPNGQDLIVISKKQIISLYGQTVGLNLTEEEILVLNSAIVETYMMTPGAELYMATYVAPGLQEAAVYTYSPTAEVINLIYANENIVLTAKNYLVEKYNTSATRGSVDSTKNQYAADAKNNVETGMEEQIEAARKAREDYLSGLEGY